MLADSAAKQFGMVHLLACSHCDALQELAWMEDTARAEQQLRDGGAETFADR